MQRPSFIVGKILILPKTNVNILLNRYTSLEYLYLSDNPLREIPPEISKLKKLQYLNLSNTQVTQLPFEMNELTSLKQIVFYRSNLSPEQKAQIKKSLPRISVQFE